jgi:hypothetical protein
MTASAFVPKLQAKGLCFPEHVDISMANHNGGELEARPQRLTSTSVPPESSPRSMVLMITPTGVLGMRDTPLRGGTLVAQCC